MTGSHNFDSRITSPRVVATLTTLSDNSGVKFLPPYRASVEVICKGNVEPADAEQLAVHWVREETIKALLEMGCSQGTVTRVVAKGKTTFEWRFPPSSDFVEQNK